MSIITDLASILGVRNAVPNQELAKQIASSEDKIALAELVQNLTHKDRNIQSDCIKTLYETGYMKPQLIAPYTDQFFQLLNSKNNRMVWGAMIALSSISSINAVEFYEHLPKILDIAGKGSVITRDAAFIILLNICKIPKHRKECFPLIREQLLSAPANQFPMYAEKSLEIIGDSNRNEYKEILTSRYNSLEKDSQKKRIDKILKKLI